LGGNGLPQVTKYFTPASRVGGTAGARLHGYHETSFNRLEARCVVCSGCLLGLRRPTETRTHGTKGARKTAMIVALARKLLIELRRLVSTGKVPDGVVLRPAA